MAVLLGHTRVGDVLPRGALTLLELNDAVKAHPHPWQTAVPPLIRVMLDEQQALFYVEAGGRQPAGFPLTDSTADACQDNIRFRAHADYDVHVTLPAHLAASAVPPFPATFLDGPRELAYDCNIPTLLNIKADLAAHDAAQGDAVVLFDQVEFMRPYYLPPLAVGDDVPYSAVHRWRAEDLLDFAQRRSTPTILVGGDELCSGLDALRDVSRLHVVVTSSAAHATTDMVIRERHRVTGAWKAPLAFSTPYHHPLGTFADNAKRPQRVASGTTSSAAHR